ncbi:DUF4148 domain-containing protein [Paraburkholderia kururiensis]|jgi:hypothetical protein|uniref:DUF4148 domain-containing protein n=1 Tax=Paraburkholderia kururiensis TaxID=984307 RepID=UPI0003458CB8|nr:DUF4148 domain-containing protein [Paraburkholderia kururiensis]
MKTFISTLAVAVALIAPVASFAQTGTTGTTGPLMRSDVKAQIAQAEQNGTLHQDKTKYPAYNAANGPAANMASAQTSNETTGYGSGVSSVSQSGQPGVLPHYVVPHSLFEHH